jgi:hypothetical protein
MTARDIIIATGVIILVIAACIALTIFCAIGPGAATVLLQ